MKTELQLYFIALLPPEPIFDEVMDYKKLFANKYDSKTGLKSPPHITLHMPFRLKEKKEEALGQSLTTLATNTDKFEIALNGFGHFNQRTIFIDVEANDSLHALFKNIMKSMKVNFNIFNADYKNRGFNPHLTLAFRDLKKESFNEAWPHFKDQPYHNKFISDGFVLLKHNGKSWDVYQTFKFKKGPEA
ncbi:2'-5' RNA ligase family protein [Fulvivirga sp. RKSG066]|uniref:2'-5' RNA ligase family protein n=1 Tax=Fulvivirga aurantia TaxID=2529383 RepID=UPI0012BC6BC9|nr:2'-5' RNA ligase family protein [Fulvivirga aurantia]MTI22666.1 2'-5' RNA ligase family protein [Fulvivirga aurantia]